MSEIKQIKAREVLDSRGNPTVEAEVLTERGHGKAAVPSGASTGKNEALELRDGGKRYGGKGVKQAISNVENEIKKALLGMDCQNLKGVDSAMIKLDGTEDKSSLGANAILSVSLAVARAAADETNKELYKLLHEKFSPGRKMEVPAPFLNIINGGEHAGNDLAVQEFMVVPLEEGFSKSIQMASEIYHSLEKVLSEQYGPDATNVGDEGGFAPPVGKTVRAIELLLIGVESAGYKAGQDIKLAIDAAASEFYQGGKYRIDGEEKTAEELSDYWEDIFKKYPSIVSLEDPFQEEDFEAFSSLTQKMDRLVVGDDLLVTNPKRIKKAMKEEACNALLLKPNQIGTLTETVEAAKLAQENGWKVIVSHRSGETCDPFISDLAMAIGAYGIKAGAPARGERTSKYNRLLAIEEK